MLTFLEIIISPGRTRGAKQESSPLWEWRHGFALRPGQQHQNTNAFSRFKIQGGKLQLFIEAGAAEPFSDRAILTRAYT